MSSRRSAVVVALGIGVALLLGWLLGRVVIPVGERVRASRLRSAVDPSALLGEPGEATAEDPPIVPRTEPDDQTAEDPPVVADVTAPDEPVDPAVDPEGIARQERALREAVEAATGDSERVAAQRALARFLQQHGRFVSAAEHWRAARVATGAAEDAQGEAESLLAFAERILVSRAPGGGIRAAFEDARIALARAKDAGADTAWTARGLARCAEAQGDPDAALRHLTEANARWPDDVVTQRALAFTLLNAQQPERAILLFGDLVEATPQDALLARALSYCARQSGNTELAASAAETAIRAAPADAAGWKSLWQAYAGDRRFGELAEKLAALATEMPEIGAGAHYAGFAYEGAGRMEDALVWLAEAWKRDPENMAARIEAARIHRDVLEDAEKAAPIYREILSRRPGHLPAVAGLGQIAVALGARQAHADALPYFEEVAAALPEDSLAQANLGLARRWLGQYDQAVAAYRRAVDLAPGDAQIRNDMGLLLLVMRDDEAAAAAFEGAHEADPLHNDGLENLGFMARERGDRAEARRWFQTALDAARRRGEDALHARHRRNVDDVRFPLPPLFD